MSKFRPLSLLMVLVTGAVFAADSTALRAISSSGRTQMSANAAVSTRSSDANAPRVKSRESSNDNKSTNKTTSNVSTRNASNARGASSVSSRKAVEERDATSARHAVVTARTAKETGAARNVTARTTGTRTNVENVSRSTESRATIKPVTKESIAAARKALEKTAELNKACQEQYNECMDQFCAVVDSNQNRCSCSANLAKYSNVEEAVKAANMKLNEIAQNIRYVGLSSDEIRAIMKETEAEQVLSGSRDSSGNRDILKQIEQMIKDPSSSSDTYSDDGLDLDISLDFSSDALDIFNLDFLAVDNNSSNSFTNLRGSELYRAARNRCNTVLTQCKKAGATVNQITGNYDLLVDKDCIAYESGLKKMNETLVSNVNSAERLLQKARLAVMQDKNQYDIKECIGALESCMTDEMVCGDDYRKCVDPTKSYIDENGEVVMGQNITSVINIMKDYNNAAITESFLASAYKNTQFSRCPTDGKCTVKYLLQKIGTKQSVEDEGLCRAVLDKCQLYTYNGKEYLPFNPVVVNYIQRAMVNIKASQSRIISEYASSCMVDVAACYNQQVTQVNSWTSSASVNSIYNIMNGACRNVALTCGLAVFVGAPDVENMGCDAASGKTGTALNSAIIGCLSEMFYQSLLCPDNSTYTSTPGNVSANETLAGYVNTRCVCNAGYVVWNGACVTPCQTGEERTSTGRCVDSASNNYDSDSSTPNVNTYTVKYHYWTGGPITNKIYKLGASVEIIQNTGEERLGYTPTNKWSYNGHTYTGGEFVDALTQNAGTIIDMYAQWTPNKYVVTYKCPNGSVLFTETATFDSEYEISHQTSECAADNSGYSVGQYWKQENEQKAYSYEDTFIWKYTDNVTFVPTDGSAIQIGLTYSCGDGATGTAPTGQSMSMASPTTTLAANDDTNGCKKTGYTFAGWDINGEVKEPGSEFTLTSPQAVIATATWTPIQYTIKFHINGASGTTPAAVPCTYDQPCTLANQDGFARDGYTFGGWNTQQNGSGQLYGAGNPASNLTSVDGDNVTLYAVWSQCTPCASRDETHVVCTLSIENNTCKYTTNCESNDYDNIQDNNKPSAKCFAKYTISYNLNGGKYGSYHPDSATYETQFTVSNPTRDDGNGTFIGWQITDMDTVTHTYGSSTTTATSIDSTTATAYKNLRSTPGTVTFTAKWNCTNGAKTDNCLLKDCPAGQYLGDDGECADCTSGYYCPDDNTAHACSALSGAPSTSCTSQTKATSAQDCSCTCPTKDTAPENCASITNKNTSVSYGANGWAACTYSVTANAGHYIFESDTANPSCPECSGNTYTTANNTKTVCDSCSAGSHNNKGHTGCEPNTFIVQYNSNGGGTNPSDTECTYGVACYPNDGSGLSKAGSSFGGWSYNGNTYTGSSNISTLTTTNDERITLTAIWVDASNIHCSAGEYLPAGASACVACTDGNYCPAGSYPYNANSDQGLKACSGLSGAPSNSFSSVSPRTESKNCRSACPEKNVPTGCATISKNNSPVTYNGSNWPTCTYSVTPKTGYHASNSPSANPSCVVNTFTVEYAANGGLGSMTRHTCDYNGTCNVKSNTFTKNGYTFDGWKCTASSGSCASSSYSNGASLSTVTTVNGATITLTAQWKAIRSGAITLDKNSTSASAPVPATVYSIYDDGMYNSNTFASSAKITGITVPVWNGRVFNGFYTATSGGTQVIGSDGKFINVAKNQVNISGGTATWYAQWGGVANTIQIKYLCPGNQTVLDNVTVGEWYFPDKSNIANKCNQSASAFLSYTLNGYKYGSGDKIDWKDFTNLWNGDPIPIATNWNNSAYTVTYTCGDGMGNPWSKTVGVSIKLPTLTDISGHCTAPNDKPNFAQWRDNITQAHYNAGQNNIIINSNKTYVAEWKSTYKVTYDCGSNSGSWSVEYNSTNIKLPDAAEATTRCTNITDKYFKSWVVNGSSQTPGTMINITNNQTIGIVWTTTNNYAGQYILTYKCGTGATGSDWMYYKTRNSSYQLEQSPINTDRCTPPSDKPYFYRWVVNGNKNSAGATITVNENKTIEALWTALLTCPAGTYINGSSCTACSGRTKWSSDNAVACATVQTGYYTTGCGADGTSCQGEVICPAGFYCENGEKKQCTGDTYSGNVGATTCTACNTGTVNSEHTQCNSCAPGSYYNNGICTTCPAGSYCTGGTHKQTCSAGTYSGDGASACTTCSAGTYSGSGATSCTACPAGKYNSVSGASSCTGNITAGYFSSGGGTSSTPTGVGNGCLSGYSCGKCAAGTYSSAGAGSCSACPAGKYSTAGVSACITPDDGYYPTGCNTSNTNCTGQTQCEKGYKCVNGVKSACSGASEYQDTTGQATCKTCAGTVLIQNGLHVGCTSCRAGTYLNNGSCMECPAGSYCPGDNQAHACSSLTGVAPSEGTYSSESGSSEANDCVYICPTISKPTNCSSVTKVSTTVRYHDDGWPNCMYSVTANKGYHTYGLNTASPSCPACEDGTYQDKDNYTGTKCTTCNGTVNYNRTGCTPNSGGGSAGGTYSKLCTVKVYDFISGGSPSGDSYYVCENSNGHKNLYTNSACTSEYDGKYEFLYAGTPKETVVCVNNFQLDVEDSSICYQNCYNNSTINWYQYDEY